MLKKTINGNENSITKSDEGAEQTNSAMVAALGATAAKTLSATFKGGDATAGSGTRVQTEE